MLTLDDDGLCPVDMTLPTFVAGFLAPSAMPAPACFDASERPPTCSASPGDSARDAPLATPALTPKERALLKRLTSWAAVSYRDKGLLSSRELALSRGSPPSVFRSESLCLTSSLANVLLLLSKLRAASLPAAFPNRLTCASRRRPFTPLVEAGRGSWSGMALEGLARGALVSSDGLLRY